MNTQNPSTIEQEEGKTFGDWAILAIAKHFNKILKHAPKVLKDNDPEELHQMRVAMRRLRSAITAFSLAVNLPEAASEKKVGKIAKILGELRDLDVLKEALENQYEPYLPKPEVKILHRGLKQLQKIRKNSLEKVRHTLKGKRYQNLQKELETWIEKPIYQNIAPIAIETILPDLLLPEISSLLLHPAWLIGAKIEEGEIKTIKFNSPQKVERLVDREGITLHDLRKKAKKIRYNMTLFTQFYGDAYLAYLDRIKSIQEILGQIQDCHVLSEFLTEILEENIEKQLPTLADLLKKNRYQKWQEWQTLQQEFINTQARQEFRKIVEFY
jgi:CHAD domain-containing protein